MRDEPAPARRGHASTCSSCTASTTSSPLEDQIGELVALQQEGKIRHIGLSEVNVDQLEAAQKIATIVSVQNMYNLTARTAEPVLEACEAQGIGFIPWFPLAAGPLAAPDGPLQRIAADHHATPSQLALAWLLKRSPVMLPIPGTSKVAHLEENVAAAEIELSDEEFETLSKAGRPPSGLSCRQYGDRVATESRQRQHRGGGFQPARAHHPRRTGLRPVRRGRPRRCRTTPARPTRPTT